jgi:hypothetical protein
MPFTNEQTQAMTSALGIPATSTPAAILAALNVRLAECAEPAAPSSTAQTRNGDAQSEGTLAREAIEQAVREGKFTAERASHYQSMARAELAQTGTTAQTRATVHALAPVLPSAPSQPSNARSPWSVSDEGHAVLTSSRSNAYALGSDGDTPLIDALDEAIFGPSEETRRRREDLAAEAELAAQLEAEREGATGRLSSAEERALFGDAGA